MIDLCAPADEYLAPGRRRTDRLDLLEIRDGLHARYRLRRAGQHNGCAVRERFADGIEGLAAHHNDVAGGHPLEPLEVVRQTPRDSVAGADYPIERHGGDGFAAVHTAGRLSHGTRPVNEVRVYANARSAQMHQLARHAFAGGAQLRALGGFDAFRVEGCLRIRVRGFTPTAIRVGPLRGQWRGCQSNVATK